MNTKKYIVSSLLLFSLGFTTPISAQIFQNNNTACESKEVLCTSGKCDDFFNPGVFSLSGKSIAGPADINGDGFPDLAAMVFATGIAMTTPANSLQQISVLLSQGKAQCGVGNGQLIELDYSLGANLDSTYTSVLVGPLDENNLSDIFVSSTLSSGKRRVITARRCHSAKAERACSPAIILPWVSMMWPVAMRPRKSCGK